MAVIKKVKGKIRAEISKLCKTIFESIQRKRLKNDNFSIICSNCVGGIIYHRLGKQFLSPTVNLWFHQDEFIKFLLDLKGYLAEELIFVESQYDYPVAMLRDIKVYFAHYHTEQEARDAWNRRKARINFDNMYIIMYDRDGITREDLLKLKEVPCRGKVVFSNHRRCYEDVDYLHTMKPHRRENGALFTYVDWLGFQTFEKQFDFVKFLNS